MTKDQLFRYALGFSYYYNENWTFRTGIAYDETPIPNNRLRTPRVPGNDRIWITLGLTYRFSDTIGLDFAYAHRPKHFIRTALFCILIYNWELDSKIKAFRSGDGVDPGIV